MRDHRIPASPDHHVGRQHDRLAMPGVYTIRVRGRLGVTALSAFPWMVPEVKAGETALTGVLEDRAALFGVLAQIEALGLELLEVRQVAAEPARQQSDGDRAADGLWG